MFCDIWKIPWPKGFYILFYRNEYFAKYEFNEVEVSETLTQEEVGQFLGGN